MTLTRLQDDFQRYLLADNNGAIERAVVGTATLDATSRLAIYHDAYRLRLLEALAGDFTALRAWVGNERFQALARAYVAAHPSDHYSLRHFGRHMRSFLAAAPYRDEPLLAELAAFDWALVDAFDAADSPVATVEQMAAIPPERWPSLCFSPHASLVRLDLEWNVPEIWQAADAGQPMPPARRAEYPICWMVWRQGLQTYFRSLDVEAAWALDALRSGHDFAAICEGLCEWIDAQHVATHAAGLLRQWISDGLIREIGLA